MRRLIGLALLFTVPLATAESTNGVRLQEVQTELKALSEDQASTTANKKALYSKLEQQSKAASQLKKTLYELELSIKKQAQKILELEQDYKKQAKAHSIQLEALNQQLRVAYTSVQPNYLKVLLNQHDPAKISRSTTYFKYFHEARQQHLSDITDSLNALSEQQTKLAMAQKQQETLFQKQQSQQRLLEEQNQQRLATIKELDSKLAKQSNRIANLKQEEEALQALFKQLESQPTPPKTQSSPKIVQTQPKTHSNKKFSQLKGQLPWPIHGKVTARYGSAKNLGKLTWQGIMINAPSGDEVKATADGIVVFSGWLRGFGLLIIVDHGDKYMSLYGNNESLLKEVGETVSSGELIALSGDKGIRQHAGLYFEIRHKGNPTNPMTWLGKQS
jgi:septal ring factor EnvC (AmiA/AmiB activator)